MKGPEVSREEVKWHLEGLREWEKARKRIAALRKLVAGDYSDQRDAGVGPQMSAITRSKPRGRRQPGLMQTPVSTRFRGYAYDIDVTDFDAFQSNMLYPVLHRLLLATAFGMPMFSFSSLDPQDAAWHQEYVRQRLATDLFGCQLGERLQKVQWDVIIAGYGGLMKAFPSGQDYVKPVHVRAEHLGWDKSRAFEDSEWRSTFVDLPIQDIDAMFGAGAYEKAAGTAKGSTDGRDVVSLHYYYNHGRNTAAVWLADGNDGTPLGDPLYHGENPFYIEVEGYRKSLNPITISAPLQVPGVEFPMSPAALAARYQIDYNRAERRARDDYDASRAIRLWNEEAVDKKDLKALRSGDKRVRDVFVKGSPKEAVLTDIPTAGISRDHAAIAGGAIRNMKEVVGVSDYQMGAGANVDFAFEANLIAQQSGIVASAYQVAHSLFLGRFMQGYLAAASLYDHSPLVIRVGDVEYPHGIGVSDSGAERIGPISMFVRPDAAVSVEEDSLARTTRQQRVAEAFQQLQQLAPFFSQFPSLAENLVGDALEAMGKPVSEYLQPSPMMMPGTEGQMAGAPQPV